MEATITYRPDAQKTPGLYDRLLTREVLLDITKADRENTADANGDGDINIIDLVRMKKYFSNGFSVKLGK